MNDEGVEGYVCNIINELWGLYWVVFVSVKVCFWCMFVEGEDLEGIWYKWYYGDFNIKFGV